MNSSCDSLTTPSNGQLPKGWQMIRFDEIAENVNDRVDPAETNLEVYVGLEHLDSESLKIHRSGTPTDVIGQKLGFQKGDIIFGKRRAYQRKLAVAESAGICSAHAMVLRAKANAIDPKFLPFFMQSDMFMERAVDISVGSLSPTINWKTLRAEQFPLPPKDEQRRIAKILATANECVERHARVVAVIKSSWQALIDDVIPDPESSTNQSMAMLQDVCEMQNGRPFPSKHYQESGHKLLRPGNLAPGGRLNWSEGATVYLGSKHVENNPDHIVQPGDVVINLTAQSLEDGFMGRVCLAVNGDESLLNQRLGRFICKGKVSSEYLYRVLQTSRFRRLVESRCEGSKVRHTYFRHFAKMPIVVLDRTSEEVVIEKARQIDRARDSAMAAESSSRELLVRLREHLLGGAAE